MRIPKVHGVCVCALLASGCADMFGSDTQEVADPAPRLTVTARFHDAVGGSNIRFCGGSGQPACAMLPPVQVRWGVGGVENSGLGFQPPPAMALSYDVPFSAGTLTHFNFPTNFGTNAS